MQQEALLVICTGDGLPAALHEFCTHVADAVPVCWVGCGARAKRTVVGESVGHRRPFFVSQKLPGHS
ncbi:MAG: hypothetical protein ACPIOQ_67750 [Promethearchaeia archaeon]